MRIKSDLTTPAARVLALLLVLLLAFAVWGISPGAARAEEPDAAPSETSLPQPDTDDDALTVTMVDGYPCVAGEVLVQFRRSASGADVQSALASVDAEEPEEISGNLHVVEVPEGETIPGYIETLEDQPNVLYAQPNYVYELADTTFIPAGGLPENRGLAELPSDPYLSLQWHLGKIGAPAAWDTTMGDSSVRVAVLDTGADLDHPDLAGRIVEQTDVVDNDSNAQDDNGHGTHVAGIIAASAGNNEGVAGMAPGVSLIIVDVFHWDSGTGSHKATTASIAAGIYYAINKGADIINMSLGGYQEDEDKAERDAIEAAINAGVVVVAAAGNDATSATIYPGDLESVICVTATGPNDEFASYSNYGSAKDIAAPGGNGEYVEGQQPLGWILSTFLDGSYAWMKGTSMAAPVVSGVAALMLSMNYNLTVEEVKNYLCNTAVDLGTPGKDDYFGHGRVSANAAMTAIPYMKTASYNINRRKSVVYNIPIGTPVSSLTADLTANNGTIEIYNVSNQKMTSGNLATAMSVRLVNGSIIKDELTIAVKGDVNGDGGLSIADYTLLRLYLLNKYSLSPAAAVASDTNSDSALNIADYTNIKLALLKERPLS